jgi:hypothetical protein
MICKDILAKIITIYTTGECVFCKYEKFIDILINHYYMRFTYNALYDFYESGVIILEITNNKI